MNAYYLHKPDGTSIPFTILNWLFPEEKSTINVGGSAVTVTSTWLGSTSMDANELYRSKPVQDFLARIPLDLAAKPEAPRSGFGRGVA